MFIKRKEQDIFIQKRGVRRAYAPLMQELRTLHSPLKRSYTKDLIDHRE